MFDRAKRLVEDIKIVFSDEDDSGQEMRRVPRRLEGIAPEELDDKWLVSQVFAHVKDPKKRFYYAVEDTDLSKGGSHVYEYSYNVYKKGEPEESSCFGNHDGRENTITVLAGLERDARNNPDYVPVSGLPGNCRRIASLYGIVFDDNGNRLNVNKNTRVTKSALFNRQSLDAIYNKKKKDKPVTDFAIANWDDVYNHIVNTRELSTETTASTGYYLSPDSCKKLLKGTENFYQTITDPHLSLRERTDALTALVKFAPNESAHPDAAFQFNVVILAALLRGGEMVYAQFATSFSDDTIQLLSSVSDNISYIAREKLDLTEQQAKQLADIIMQGPNPYQDKPLPLEAWLAATDPSAKPAPPNTRPPGFGK